MFIGDGDALGEMLIASEANCLECGKKIIFEDGANLARENGIDDNVVVCNTCLSVFTVILAPGRMTLEENVTNRYGSLEKKKGCFIATSIYGFYDCPEVWTLRRYRDNNLLNTIQGKIFIKIYYFLSPSFVKYFGNRQWFKKLFKKRLDNFVEKLQKEGVESTYYVDK